MKKFPTLNEKQVVVVIADGATGHVLNIKLELYLNNTEDEIYWLFNNIDLAKEFIQKQSVLNDKLEFLIYDSNESILEYIEAIHWKNS
ncbi:hypothetical protein EYY60_08030 [Flavobacterium zhairuonense]|uniref:hypothetical protein n=1 Tax=Flavobacterium zhairuonense TaxID=2493631 RepID=UPI0010455CE6|nr:hypothetical protein [Flavobacterium zhairuonense]KAF2511370.1 hypothetical protein EYY60_08030 [Flavobacterium zhairuonense]